MSRRPFVLSESRSSRGLNCILHFSLRPPPRPLLFYLQPLPGRGHRREARPRPSPTPSPRRFTYLGRRTAPARGGDRGDVTRQDSESQWTHFPESAFLSTRDEIYSCHLWDYTTLPRRRKTGLRLRDPKPVNPTRTTSTLPRLRGDPSPYLDVSPVKRHSLHHIRPVSPCTRRTPCDSKYPAPVPDGAHDGAHDGGRTGA